MSSLETGSERSSQMGSPSASGSSAAVVRGNLIGTNAAGTAAIPNRTGGITINSANDNIIGGTSATARNVISGNGVGTTFAVGVSIFNASSNNQILGNYIGTNAAGTAIVANTSSGVQISGSGTGNVVGGAAVGAGNLISGNGKNGQFASGIHISPTFPGRLFRATSLARMRPVPRRCPTRTAVSTSTTRTTT